jgi:hypothetical protein
MQVHDAFIIILLIKIHYENSLNRCNRLYREATLPLLVEQGHEIICCVKDKNRFYPLTARQPYLNH